MVCATGMVFKASTGLLKSVSNPFESFAVTESIRVGWPDQELRAWLNTRLCIHILYCLVWMESHSLTWKNCILSSASLSNTCRFGYRNALKRVCECLISFLCQRITFLAPVLMHAMSSNTLVAAIWPKAVEWGFYGFYDLRILLSHSLWIIWCVLFDSPDLRSV